MMAAANRNAFAIQVVTSLFCAKTFHGYSGLNIPN